MAVVPKTLENFLPSAFPYTSIDFISNNPSRRAKNVNVDFAINAQTALIQLPNGSIYDAHQTYDAAQLLPEVTVTFVVLTKDATDPTSEIRAEQEVIDGVVGRDGTLYGTDFNHTYVSANARFISASFRNLGAQYDQVSNSGIHELAMEVRAVFQLKGAFS